MNESQSFFRMSPSLLRDLAYVREYAHQIITVKTSGPTKDPLQLSNRNVKKKENIPDKKLFSYRQLGGVRHILLCLAFVLLHENMWCVWAGLSIPLRHVSQCYEKSRNACPPTKKMILMWDVLEEYVDEY